MVYPQGAPLRRLVTMDDQRDYPLVGRYQVIRWRGCSRTWPAPTGAPALCPKITTDKEKHT